MGSSIRVRYIGSFFAGSGYGQAGRDTLMALKEFAERENKSLELDIQPIQPGSAEDIHKRYHDLLPYVEKEGDPNWPTHTIVHTIPAYCHEYITGDMETTSHKIAMTTWETSRFPSWIAERLTSFDSIWVPSSYNSSVLRRAGLYSTVVPHPYDPKWWTLGDGSAFNDKTFRFLWVGAWAERKNPMGVLKAYFHAFTDKDPVELIMVCKSPIAAQDLQLFTLSCGKPDWPKVTLVQERLTDEDLRTLYNSVQCYVSAHHAEGFGLGIFEATILDVPVIATGYSGNLDFSASSKIKYMLTPAITDPNISGTPSGIPGVSAITKVDPTGISVDHLWAEPDLRNMADTMRSYVDRYPKASRWSNPDVHRVRKNYTYERVGRDIYGYLQKALVRRG